MSNIKRNFIMSTTQYEANINNLAICREVANIIVGGALEPYRDFPLRRPYVKTEEAQALLQVQFDKFLATYGRQWYDEGSKENVEYFHHLLNDTYDSCSTHYQAQFIADNKDVWDIFLTHAPVGVDFDELDYRRRYNIAYERLCRDFATPEEFSEFVDRHFANDFLATLEAA